MGQSFVVVVVLGFFPFPSLAKCHAVVFLLELPNPGVWLPQVLPYVLLMNPILYLGPLHSFYVQDLHQVEHHPLKLLVVFFSGLYSLDLEVLVEIVFV